MLMVPSTFYPYKTIGKILTCKSIAVYAMPPLDSSRCIIMTRGRWHDARNGRSIRRGKGGRLGGRVRRTTFFVALRDGDL